MLRTLSMALLGTKKRYSSVLKKVLVLQETCFRVKVSKTFKIFSDLLLLTFKYNFCEEAFSCVKTKTKSLFAVKFVEKGGHPFSAYLMNHLNFVIKITQSVYKILIVSHWFKNVLLELFNLQLCLYYSIKWWNFIKTFVLHVLLPKFFSHRLTSYVS